ncbi:MAG: hypothetical protein QOG57_6735, partial [Pseudonocardiales bacterium]|nr:hypothetical protein [Pseudonocardiales bacterium]
MIQTCLLLLSMLAPGRALGDPADPARLRAEYDSGARVYPDGLGIQA